MSSSTIASTPALTTLWTSPDGCSTSWTYDQYTGSYYTYINQFPGVTTSDVPCRVPNWGVNDGTFSPGVCPYLWKTWTSTVINGSITSAHCCPSGYINQGPDCGSLFTTTMTSVTVYSESDSSPTIGFVPPGTAVLSAVHVLHQASDLSVLPAPVSAIPSTGELSTGSIAGIVIGAVVAALLLVGAAWYVWHWKRRSTAQKTQKDGSGGLGELHGEDSHRQELPTEERVGEVAGSNVAIELPNAHTAKPRPPVELPG